MRTASLKIGRNDPCPCGSGRKYKHCCFASDRERGASARAEEASVRDALQRAMDAHGAGRLGEAEAAYDQALQLRPGNAWAHFNLGNVLQAQGRLSEAADSFRRSAELQPDSVEAYCNLGSVLKAAGRVDEAIGVYRGAIAARPQAASVHFNLGNALKDRGSLEEAIACYRRTLELEPRFEGASLNLAVTLEELGRTEEALAEYRRTLALEPGNVVAYDNLLFLAGYQCMLPPEEYLALARGWERAVVPAERRDEARRRRFANGPLAGRRLRLGYVSGDFRRHAVSYFIEQILACHDRSRFEVFAYPTVGIRDEVTARIESRVEHWVPVAELSDAAMRDRVAADGVDVLVDLAGHTGRSRLGAFALRAAPVQASYLGYFASTGLTEMDYWIGDAILTPPSDDGQFSERLWRLPRIWVSYEGKPEAPEPAWRPAADGSLRLGSFNALKKLTPATVALWSKVLRALPEAWLLLKTRLLGDPSNRRRVLDAFAAHGVAADRLELQDDRGTADWSVHMAQYDRLDIALDPVGAVAGGTTTCDALWMGVPVVGLRGERTASRMTASMLHAIGRDEWLAATEDAYVAVTVALARDVEGRRRMRAEQRARVAASPLCDAPDLTRHLEQAYAGMYERWQVGRAGAA